jgi:hypothetical protein
MVFLAPIAIAAKKLISARFAFFGQHKSVQAVTISFV